MNRFKSRSSAVTVAIGGVWAGRRRHPHRLQRRAGRPDRHPAGGGQRHRGQRRRTSRCATSTCGPRRQSDYVQPGSEVELLFVASNESPDIDDKLTSITSDVGTVTLSGDTSLPAQRRPRRRRARRPGRRARADRDRRRGQGHGRHQQADHQRPDLQLHLHLREGRPDHGRGADLGRRGAAPRLGRRRRRTKRAATRAVITEDLSAVADTVTSWPRRVRSTAVRSATTSPRNGSAAARIAAPGARSTK